MSQNLFLCPDCNSSYLKVNCNGKPISKRCVNCANIKNLARARKAPAKEHLLFCKLCCNEFSTTFKEKKYCSELCKQKSRNVKSNETFIKEKKKIKPYVSVFSRSDFISPFKDTYGDI